MSISTDGQICYGILLGGKDDEIIINDTFIDPRDLYKWIEERYEDDSLSNVEFINSCHLDYPVWILAIEDSVLIAHRGYPKAIEETNLQYSDLWDSTLKEFCRKHKINIENREPKWYLSSYWG